MNSILSSTVSLLFEYSPSSKDSIRDSTSLSKSNTETFGEASQVSNKQKAITWIQTNGKKWLEEAMRRLGLDGSKVDGKSLIGKTTEQLSEEKNQVKSELKKYDANFVLLFRRLPERTEKEPIRPLYVYYKKVKEALAKNAGKKRAGGSSMHEQARRIEKRKLKAKEEGKKFAGVKVYNEYTFKTDEELKEKIAELKSERAHLRILLDKFQQEFIKTYNRKIKYNRDIAPVSNQFKRYKELKKIIADLEILLDK